MKIDGDKLVEWLEKEIKGTEKFKEKKLVHEVVLDGVITAHETTLNKIKEMSK